VALDRKQDLTPIRKAFKSLPSQKIPYTGLEGGRYKPLDEAGVKRIVEAGMFVLEKTGIEVKPSPCQDVWRKAGARIDSKNNRVYIPQAMVEDAICKASNEVTLCGRDPDLDIHLGGTKVYLGTGGAAVKVLDLNGKVRQSRLQDLYDIGRLVDFLENIHFYHRPVVANDIPADLLDVNTFYACLSATQKHVMGSCISPESVRQVVELVSLFTGGLPIRQKPVISLCCSWIISPLCYSLETVGVLDEAVRQSIPVAISSAPQTGATSPAALAGTLVQLTAEQLSGLTYINLLIPGHPVILGYVPSVSDLRTGVYSGGGPEFAMMNAASAQLAQYLNVPVYVSSGVTDSKLPDIQAGYEKGYSTAIAALAGANYIHHSAGMLESLLTVAYEQYVIDDEINSAVLRMVRGIEVNDESLSVDVIDEVVNKGDQFLEHPQTLKLMKTEFVYPHTANRENRGQWEEAGSWDMREAARNQAAAILENYWPELIDEGRDKEIRSKFDIQLPRCVMKNTI
jgi:trimethylamine---corrinoid protein Co-methyltransferase